MQSLKTNILYISSLRYAVEPDLVEPNDVRVLQEFHDFNLSSNLTTILSIQSSLVNDLNGNLGGGRERRERERENIYSSKKLKIQDTGINIPTRHFKCLSIP